MKIIIETKDFEDEEIILNYFYYLCLDNPDLDKFSVEIEGTDLKKSK